MPHQCLGCDTVYDNTSDAIIKGCPNCKGKLFLFMKKKPEEKESLELTREKKELIMKEVENFVEVENTPIPIILKLENIRILSPGKYEIDINQLMKKEKPIIFKIQDGTYIIDLNYINNNVK